MSAAHWYRRRWNEARGDRHEHWGHSTCYFETTSTGQVRRQVEIYDNGTVRRYDRSRPADRDGTLSEADLPAARWRPYSITQALFDAAWQPTDEGGTGAELLEFVEVGDPDQNPLRTWLLDVPADAAPGPVWRGLRELEYPDGENNPFLAYGISNADGEFFHLLRAIAWAACGPRRIVSPGYYRDEAANQLGVPRDHMLLTSWEYELDEGDPDLATADHGYVTARACVPMRPRPDGWQIAHAAQAGLLPLETFTHLSAVDVAVAGDASSEITLYGLDEGSSETALAAALNTRERPTLASVLDTADTVVHLSQIRDLYVRGSSRLVIRSRGDLRPDLARLASAAGVAWTTYLEAAEIFTSWNDFHAGIRTLTDTLIDERRAN